MIVYVLITVSVLAAVFAVPAAIVAVGEALEVWAGRSLAPNVAWDAGFVAVLAVVVSAWSLGWGLMAQGCTPSQCKEITDQLLHQLGAVAVLGAAVVFGVVGVRAGYLQWLRVPAGFKPVVFLQAVIAIALITLLLR